VPEGQKNEAEIISAYMKTGQTDIMQNSYMAIATTQSRSGYIVEHYAANDKPDNRFNSLITGQVKNQEIPSGALLAVLLKLVSQNQTTVVTAGCEEGVVKKIENSLGTGFRLFRLARLEIDKLVKEFLAALQATASSL
jgi:hypothetical protein